MNIKTMATIAAVLALVATPAFAQNHTGTPSPGAPLSALVDANDILTSATVLDSTGRQIGQVSTVHTNANGVPTKVDVTLEANGGDLKVVSIDASRLRYDSNSDTLTTDVPAAQVIALPNASDL